MQSNAQKLWIKDPSASSIVVNGSEVVIDKQITILAAPVTACAKECASPCGKEVWEIKFNNVNFGTCNDCGKSVGFFVVLQRNPDFDTETYLQFNGRKLFTYQGTKVGTITGTTLAQYFYDDIVALQDQNDQHDLFYLEAEIDGGDPTILRITLPCTGLYTYQFQAVGQIPDNNLEAAELPAITNPTPGVDAKLSKEKLLRQYPMAAGYVFGDAPKDFFMWCEDTCLIKLRGCYDPCTQDVETQGTGQLSTGAQPFELLIYINSTAPGFPDFITALNAAFTACTVDDAPGINGVGLVEIISGGQVIFDIDNNFEFPATGGLTFTLDNGSIAITVKDVTSGADLQAKLAAAYPSGTFAFLSPNLTVSGIYITQANGTAVTLTIAGEPHIYTE